VKNSWALGRVFQWIRLPRGHSLDHVFLDSIEERTPRAFGVMGISARFYAVPCYLPLTSYYSFPSSYCLLLSHYYLLHTTYYLLPTTLRVGEHLLFTICYLLTSERRGQVADHSFRAVVSACGLHAVHSTLRGVQLLTARVVSATPGTPTHYYSLPLTPTDSYSPTTCLTHSPPEHSPRR
jgi:hypothetical protein